MDKKSDAGVKAAYLWALAFALTMYQFLLTELLVNDLSATRLGKEASIYLYALTMASAAAGYLAFALRARGRSASRLWISGGALLSGLCLTAAAAAPFPSLLKTGACASLFCVGVSQGCLCADMSRSMQGSPFLGRTAGAGICGAVAAQYAVQTAFHGRIFLQALSIVVAALALSFLQRRLPQGSSGNTERADSGRVLRIMGPSIAVALLASLILNAEDCIATALHATGNINVGDWPRLCYALSALLAGCLADWRKGRWLGLALLCVLLTSLSFYALPLSAGFSPSFYPLLIYVQGGFYVVYLTSAFIKKAALTGYPELWAGMGRVIRSLSLAAILLFMAEREIRPLPMMAANTVLLALLAGVVAVKNQPAETGVPAPPLSAEERLAFYARSHGLTERENEVLAKVLESERPLREIALDVYMSERVLQRRLSSIYAKAGVKSRRALLRDFYDCDASPQTPAAPEKSAL